MKEHVKKTYQSVFHHEPSRYFVWPGRVNLIGEHTDYNGGHVFPCALTFGTYVAYEKRLDQRVMLYSDNFPIDGVIAFNLPTMEKASPLTWAEYVKGVIHVLHKKGYTISHGFQAAVHGNIPNGAGLSSSASVELAFLVLLNEVFQFGIDPITLALYAQEAENQYIGVNCGIMDQFAIAMGKKDHAILLNTQTLYYEQVPLHLGSLKIVIINTNKQRNLHESKYNERRSECEAALKDLQKELAIQTLGDLDNLSLEAHKALIQNPLHYKRARHAVSENVRTIEAVKQLRVGNLEAFKQAMLDSHASLKNDYEVTGFELDALQETAMLSGAYAARMTGAGFGGCVVSLVNEADIPAFQSRVITRYMALTQLTPSFYIASIGPEAQEIKEEEL